MLIDTYSFLQQYRGIWRNLQYKNSWGGAVMRYGRVLEGVKCLGTYIYLIRHLDHPTWVDWDWIQCHTRFVIILLPLKQNSKCLCSTFEIWSFSRMVNCWRLIYPYQYQRRVPHIEVCRAEIHLNYKYWYHRKASGIWKQMIRKIYWRYTIKQNRARIDYWDACTVRRRMALRNATNN